MLKYAALALAAASAASAESPSALVSTAPWWEKVVVTISGDGKTQSCTYESSLAAAKDSGCEVAGSAPTRAAASGTNDQFTRITFERRFIPGGQQPGEAKVQPGDTLLGQQVMALAIDGAGAVRGCQVIARGGDMTPDYGCEEVRAERFEAAARAAGTARQGYMTILVYGHAENIA